MLSLGPKFQKKVVARAEVPKNGGGNGHLFLESTFQTFFGKWCPKKDFLESGFQKKDYLSLHVPCLGHHAMRDTCTCVMFVDLIPIIVC